MYLPADFICPEIQGLLFYPTARCFRAERRASGMCVLFLCRFAPFPHSVEGEFLIFEGGEAYMDKKIGIIGIVIEELTCAEQVNAVLHEYAGLIVGRMGLPYR
ncbi:MAG: hypothetical protein AB7C97_05870, partial [Oscillospiraceae bacterium]